MDVAETLEQLTAQVRELQAEAQARKVLGRYLFLCDTPLAEYGMTEEERATAIGELFTPEAIWEGAGATHGAQFGRKIGPDAIAAHMLAFHIATDPHRIFNTHYLCSEQVHATMDGAEGQWVQFQPWIYDNGDSILRSSRLHVRFRPTDDGWKICHYRTENLFIAPLPDGWTSALIGTSVLMEPQDRPVPTMAPA